MCCRPSRKLEYQEAEVALGGLSLPYLHRSDPTPAESGICCRDQGWSQVSLGQQGPGYISPEPLQCSAPAGQRQGSWAGAVPAQTALMLLLEGLVQQQEPQHRQELCPGVLPTPWGTQAPRCPGTNHCQHCCWHTERGWHTAEPAFASLHHQSWF